MKIRNVEPRWRHESLTRIAYEQSKPSACGLLSFVPSLLLSASVVIMNLWYE
jgi:hypothetical protein